jgi:DNA-binding NarL/FixJ family response regulator
MHNHKFGVSKDPTRYMQVALSSQQLEILRKSASGISPRQIANELNVSEEEVERSLSVIMKSTHSKEPVHALQALAKQGFSMLD